MADEKRSVQFTIDNSKALKSLASLRKAQEQLAETAIKTDKSFDKAAESFGDYNKSVKQSIGGLAKQKRSLEDSTDEIDKQKRALQALEAELDQIDEQFSRTSQLVGQAGDVGSAGRTIGGAIGAFGGDTGGAIESAISALSELPDTLEAIPRLQDSFKALPRIATLTADKLGLGGLAGSMQNLIPGLGAGTASTIALAGAALALAAPIAAIVFAFGEYNKAAEAQRKVLSAVIDANRKVREDVAEGLTSDEAEARLEELKSLREGEVTEMERLQGAYKSMEEQLGVLSGAVKVFDGREEELFNRIEDGKSTVAGYDAEIKSLEARMADGSLTANDAAISEEELADARKSALAAIDAQIKQAESRSSQALQRANSISEQINNAQEQRAQSAADKERELALESKFAAEDQLKQEQEYRDNLADISASGRDRILKLESGFADLANDRAEALADVDSKGNKKLADLRNDYFKSQRKAVADFNKESEKLQGDSAKRIQKIAKDLQSSLDDAARDNNVIAFLETQRRAQEQISEEQQNASDSEAERLQAFKDRQAEEIAAFQEKQATIYAGIQEEKQKVIESYNEKRIALAQQIEEEKVAIQQRIEAERQRYAEQEAREAEQVARQAERDALREELEREAFERRQKELEEQRRKELDAYNEEQRNIETLANLKRQTSQLEIDALNQIQAGTQNLVTLAGQLKTAASSASTGRGSSFGSRSSGGSSRFGYSNLNNQPSSFGRTTLSGGKIRPFHDGGRVAFPGADREGLVLARKGEIIVDPNKFGFPDNNSDKPLPLFNENKQASAGKVVNVTFAPNNNTQVGDIANVSSVETAMNRNNQTMMEKLVQMIEEVTAP